MVAFMRRRKKPAEQSINVIARTYGAFQSKQHVFRYTVGLCDGHGEMIPNSEICFCRGPQEAEFIAHSMTYALASASLAKPFVMDLLEL